MIAKNPEKIVNLKITYETCLSDMADLETIIRNKVIGALESLIAFSLKSSVIITGFNFIARCSTIRFVLDKNKKELIIAGSKAIADIIFNMSQQ